MFNCRVLETRLQKTFPHDHRRLWLKIGAGSYYLSEEAIQVRSSPPPPFFFIHQLTRVLQDQIEYSRISKVFVVHAPMSVCHALNFCENLPLFARQ